MALSVVDLYARILPRTNCGDCGYPTCIAFAGMVVSQKLPLDGCPHLSKETIEQYQPEWMPSMPPVNGPSAIRPKMPWPGLKSGPRP